VRASFRALSTLLGCLCVAAGVAMIATFFRGLLPDPPELSIPVDSNGLYFVAFAGCGMVGWGGALFSAARSPESSGLATALSALALVGMALYRMWGWFLGDYAFLGELPRLEAALFLVFALALIWLRPGGPAREVR
jgi:hypothetical protein